MGGLTVTTSVSRPARTASMSSSVASDKRRRAAPCGACSPCAAAMPRLRWRCRPKSEAPIRGKTHAERPPKQERFPHRRTNRWQSRRRARQMEYRAKAKDARRRQRIHRPKPFPHRRHTQPPRHRTPKAQQPSHPKNYPPHREAPQCHALHRLALHRLALHRFAPNAPNEYRRPQALHAQNTAWSPGRQPQTSAPSHGHKRGTPLRNRSKETRRNSSQRRSRQNRPRHSPARPLRAGAMQTCSLQTRNRTFRARSTSLPPFVVHPPKPLAPEA